MGQDIHTVFRSVDRSFLFHDWSDQMLMLNALKRQKRIYKAPIYAWVGMSNHHHIFNQAPTEWHEETDYAKAMKEAGAPISVGHMMRDIHSLFARKLNQSKKREGGVIKDRTKTIKTLDPEHALTLLVYLFLNPVRAGIVKHPRNYHHSAFHLYAYGTRRHGTLFSLHPAYLALGRRPEDRQRRFRQLMDDALRKWARSRHPGASASHGRGPGVGEKARQHFIDLAKAWIFFAISPPSQGPPKLN